MQPDELIFFFLCLPGKYNLEPFRPHSVKEKEPGCVYHEMTSSFRIAFSSW